MHLCRKIMIVMVIPLMVGLSTGTCGSSDEASPGEPTLNRIKKTGKIRIGYANEAPFAYRDSKKDIVTGEAPEVTRVILGRMGVSEIEGVLTEFGSLIPGLNAGRFDMIAAGMYITPARYKVIGFSNPTYRIDEGFIVKAGNPLGLHSYEDAEKHATARLGVVVGTVELSYAKDMGIPQNRVIVFPDTPSALAGVQAGRVDAFTGTKLTIMDLLKKADSDALERAKPFQPPVINGQVMRGYGAMGFRKEDTEFIEAFNLHLDEFIGTPEHLALIAPFGFTDEELPGDVTAEMLGESPASATN